MRPRRPAAAISSSSGAYAIDFVQRSILFLDALRQRGNNFVEHERKGLPPVLQFDYEIVMDGRTFEYGYVQFARCRVGSEGLTTKALGFKDLPVPDDPSPEDIELARRDIDKRQLGEAILPADKATWYCGRCLAYCPVGSERERSMLEGLSSGPGMPN